MAQCIGGLRSQIAITQIHLLALLRKMSCIHLYSCADVELQLVSICSPSRIGFVSLVELGDCLALPSASLRGNTLQPVAWIGWTIRY